MIDDYIPYSDEWRKEMRRWNKEQLIDGFRDANVARQEAEAEVKRLTETLRAVRDIVPQICQAQLGRDCHCGAVTHIIDNALLEREGDEG